VALRDAHTMLIFEEQDEAHLNGELGFEAQDYDEEEEEEEEEEEDYLGEEEAEEEEKAELRKALYPSKKLAQPAARYPSHFDPGTNTSTHNTSTSTHNTSTNTNANTSTSESISTLSTDHRTNTSSTSTSSPFGNSRITAHRHMPSDRSVCFDGSVSVVCVGSPPSREMLRLCLLLAFDQDEHTRVRCTSSSSALTGDEQRELTRTARRLHRLRLSRRSSGRSSTRTHAITPREPSHLSTPPSTAAAAAAANTRELSTRKQPAEILLLMLHEESGRYAQYSVASDRLLSALLDGCSAAEERSSSQAAPTSPSSSSTNAASTASPSPYVRSIRRSPPNPQHYHLFTTGGRWLAPWLRVGEVVALCGGSACPVLLRRRVTPSFQVLFDTQRVQCVPCALDDGGVLSLVVRSSERVAHFTRLLLEHRAQAEQQQWPASTLLRAPSVDESSFALCRVDRDDWLQQRQQPAPEPSQSGAAPTRWLDPRRLLSAVLGEDHGSLGQEGDPAQAHHVAADLSSTRDSTATATATAGANGHSSASSARNDGGVVGGGGPGVSAGLPLVALRERGSAAQVLASLAAFQHLVSGPDLLPGESILFQDRRVSYACSAAFDPHAIERSIGAASAQQQPEPVLAVAGELLCTTYQLVFSPYSVSTYEDHCGSATDSKVVRVPLALANRLVLTGSANDTLQVHCKTLMRHAFVFEGTSRRRRAERLQAAIREHGQPGRRGFTRLYAFAHLQALRRLSVAQASAAQRPWFVWQIEQEFRRQGVLPSSLWRLSRANLRYELCASYPALLLVPAHITDAQLLRSSAYRGKGRLPSLSWRHPTNGASVIRCAQPRAGLTGGRCAEDELLVSSILTTAGARVSASQLVDADMLSHLTVVDARDPASAIANRVFRGAGHEDAAGGYDARLLFLGIPNMHAVSSAANKLASLLHDGRSLHSSSYLVQLHETQWLQHLSALLQGARQMAERVAMGESVLLHCSDGWDRTPQLASLVQLMLDPHFRTLRGFMELLDREWLSFGHQFHLRGSVGQSQSSGFSPIFLQFMDACRTLRALHAQHYEFNEEALREVLEHSMAARFGTFLLDSEKARIRHRLPELTASLWSSMLSEERRSSFCNQHYHPCSTQLIPTAHALSVCSLSVWTEAYLQQK